MKLRSFIFLFLLAVAGPVRAQYLSLRELLELAEKGFDMPEKLFRSKGFAGVRWRHDAPDINGDAGAYKEYSRTADAYLVFHPDAHGRLLEELIYRFRSPLCVVSLKKQLVAAGFDEVVADQLATTDPNTPIPHFSSYDGYYSNARYILRIVGKVDSNGKEQHHYAVSIECTAAMQEMQDAIDVVNQQVRQAEKAKHAKQRPR